MLFCSWAVAGSVSRHVLAPSKMAPFSKPKHRAQRRGMMQVGLELGRRTIITVLLCPNQARAAVSRSAAPASSGMRIHLTRGCRVPPRASGGAGGCGVVGGAAGHHACDTPVHRPACWGLARESFARCRAALSDPSQWRLRAWGDIALFVHGFQCVGSNTPTSSVACVCT